MNFHMTLKTMEPLFPEDNSGEIESFALDLISKSGRLSGTIENTQKLNMKIKKKHS